MKIEVARIEDTHFQLEAVFVLLQDSFSLLEKESGIRFNLLRYSFDDIKERIEKEKLIVLVAFSEEKLLGTRTLKWDSSRKIAEGMWLAVSPKVQGKGVGSKLMNFGSNLIKLLGGKYIWEDTAIEAKSSVKMHEKNGYYIIGLVSYTSTDYYSYVFRKQLTTPSVYSHKFLCHLRFVFSYLLTKSIKNRYGELNTIGQLLNTIKNNR